MSSSSVDNESGADEETINGDVPTITDPAGAENGIKTGGGGGRIAQLLQEEREAAPTPLAVGNGTNAYKDAASTLQGENRSEDGSVEGLPRRPASPGESVLSIPDDTPSVQVITLRNYIGNLLIY